MALFRALESFRPPSLRLFEDRLARELLRPSLRIVADLSRAPFLGVLIPWIIDQRWPGARSSGIARTRFIDEALVEAIEDGIEQVVILGAGFDCRAYRLSNLERARIFEVDHPDTLTAKREHLRRALRGLPPHVVFAEIDFNQQQIKDVLAASSFDSARRTFFIWEGVTNYLSEQAVDATLRFVSTVAAGSRLISPMCIAASSTTPPSSRELETSCACFGRQMSLGLSGFIPPSCRHILTRAVLSWWRTLARWNIARVT
jgi:methyltransferase (TIGR00027 family)